jgi:hypothetical protein
MKTKRIFLGLASMIVAFALIFSACTKSGLNENGAVAVFLTDGPGDFDAVNIDIQKVEVKVDKDEKHKRDDNRNSLDDDKDDHLKRKDDFGEWIDLNFAPKVIDVLSLRNGIETQLGTADGTYVVDTVNYLSDTSCGSGSKVFSRQGSFTLGTTKFYTCQFQYNYTSQ